MRRFIPIVLFLLVLFPLAASAVVPVGPLFDDVRIGSREEAGIDLLARRGIVEGYGNGRFGPSRLVNRAEFLKIAMASAGDKSTYLPQSCFDDVQLSDWFSPFVCAAKEQGIVSGRTPVTFVPADPVQYGEALKMLTLLYGYEVGAPDGNSWAEPYYRAAAQRGVDLPVTIRLDSVLTRGQAARLAAAFLAESEGFLAELRLAESGEISPYALSASASSSSSVSSVSSASSASSASSVSSSSVSSTPFYTLPPVSHFLLVGTTSDAIASLTARSPGEAARVASVRVKLAAEVRSMRRLELTTVTGAVVMELLRRTTTDTSDYKLTFEGSLPPEKPWMVPADTDVPLVLRAVVRGIDDNGFSEELLEVRTFTVTLQGQTSNASQTAVGVAPFPQHQTAFGRIVSIVNGRPAVLQDSTGALIGSFTFSGTTLPSKPLSLSELLFGVRTTGTVQTGNWYVTRRGGSAQVPCSIGSDTRITCTRLADILGSIPASEPLIVDVHADLAREAGGDIRIVLEEAGSPSTLGSVQWTDGSGMFRWVEAETLRGNE